MATGIFVFHKVCSHKNKDIWIITLDELIQIIRILEKYGTIIEPFCSKNLGNDSMSFMLHFDDGTRDHYEIVAPLLNRLGYKGIFFICTSKLDKQGYLTTVQLKELITQGHEIGSHAHTHVNLTSLSINEIQKQVITSISILESIIERDVKWFAPPGGIYDNRVIKVARDHGIKYFRTTKFGWSSFSSNTRSMQILKTFNVSRFFRADQIEHCLSKNTIYVKYFAIFRLKEAIKKLSPRIYHILSSIADKRICT